MNKLIRRINQNMSIGSATMLIAGSLVIGIILGVIRTKLINADFNNEVTGAYFAAFKIPEFIFYTLSSGALSVAFIPVFSDKLIKGGRQQAWALTSSVLNTMALAMFFICLILILFPKQILAIIAPGLEQDVLYVDAEESITRLDLAAQIMRLAATGPLVFSVASILSSVQQVFGRFLFFAVGPIFYNLCIIASMYLFKNSIGIVSLGVGAAIGGLLHLLIFSVGMYRLNFKHTWFIDFKNKAYQKVFQALPFRSFNEGVVYINSVVQLGIASLLPGISAITHFENALILYNAPSTLLGVALGTAIFPHFTRRLTENRPDLFKKEFLQILGIMIWVAIPVVLISYFCRDYMAKIIFIRDFHKIAPIFGWLCLGIFFRALYAIISRFYYAQKDTLTPLLVTLLAFVVNIGLSWLLSQVFGVIGFGMAISIAAAIEILFLIGIIVYRDKNLFKAHFIRHVTMILALSVPTAVAVYFAVDWVPTVRQDGTWELIWKLAFISVLTGGVHLLISYSARLYEARRFMSYAQRAGNRFLRVIHSGEK